MTEVKERQHDELGSWAGESNLMGVVRAASALEESASDALRVRASLERDWWQYTQATVPDTLRSLRELERIDRVRHNRELIDALAAAVRAYGDAVAAQLEITPDQLYSMTFADFIDKYEQDRATAKGGELSKRKSLVEQLNEAYDEDAEREDEEFFRTTKAYYRRRFHAED